jgi:hypothetical protein
LGWAPRSAWPSTTCKTREWWEGREPLLFFTDRPFGLPALFDDPTRELPFSGVVRVKDGAVELLTDPKLKVDQTGNLYACAWPTPACGPH